MWFLNGARPRIDVLELPEFAVMLERPRLRPGPQHQIHCLLEHGPGVGRVHREAVVFWPAADYQPRDQPTAADDVDHCEFFGDACHRAIEWQRVADHGDFYALRL